MAMFDRFFLVFCLTLIQLAQISVHYGMALSLKGASIGIVAIAMGGRVFLLTASGAPSRGGSIFYLPKKSLLLVLFLFFLILASFRSALGGDVDVASVVVALAYEIALILVGVNYFSLRFHTLSWRDSVKYFACGVVFYVVLNFFLYLIESILGFSPNTSTEAGDNLTLQLLGLDASRALFPLAYGINAYGNVAALGLISSVFLFKAEDRVGWRQIFLLSAFVSFASLVLVESRGAIVSLALAVVCFQFSNRKLMWIFAFLAPLMPLIIYFVMLVFEEIGVFELFIRGGAGFSGLVTDRDIIWGTALNELSEYKLIHLFGYGLFGNSVSGLMRQYDWLFEYSDDTFRTLHNYGLQYLVDIGYLGFCFFTLMVVSYFRKLSVVGECYGRDCEWFFGVLMLFLLFQGGFEAVPTVYAQESFFVFLFSLFAVFFCRRAVKRPAVR